MAAIYSDSDIYLATRKLRDVSLKDMMSFVNKTDLVGNRASNFNMQTMQYQRTVSSAVDSLQSITNRIDIVRNSMDYSDSEKDMKTRELYQEADAVLSNIHGETINYLMGLNRTMPTITHQRFVKRFQEYYNGLNIGSSQINFR